MEENNEKKWVLYCHIAPNGKLYFGITCQTLNQRCRNGNGYKSCPFFYNAIKKYGWDNFKHEILAHGLSFDRAAKMEKMYIALYRTTDEKYGYNITDGGQGVTGDRIPKETRIKINLLNSKPVYQLDKDLNVIAEFNSQSDAAKITGFHREGIGLCCRRAQRQCGGFKWCFQNYLPYVKDDPWYLNDRPSKKRAVYMYTLDNILIHTYESVRQAAEDNHIVHSSLASAIRSKRQFKGYFWSYSKI